MPKPARALLALSTLLAAAAALAAPARPAADLARARAELDAALSTRGLVAEKLSAREADLAVRVRALYKLTRAGTTPLWAAAEARAELVRRRAAARRLLVRDLEERALLAAELSRAQAQVERGQAALAALAAGTPETPIRHLLRAPVGGRADRGYGLVRDPATAARILSRGWRWPTIAGAVISAPASGTLRHLGPLRGLGRVALIALPGPDELTVLVSGLVEVAPGLQIGQTLSAGTRLGLAGKGFVLLELRRHGRTVDPAGYF